MTQMTDGENKLSNVRQNLQKVETAVDKYLEKLCLNDVVEQDVSFYLSCTREQMKGMSPEECREASIVLSREALYVQNEINRLQNRMDWAKFRFDQLVASEIEQMDRFTKDEYKRHMIAQNSPAALEYQQIISECERYICRLNFIPNKLERIADSFGSYEFSKRKALESSRGY